MNILITLTLSVERDNALQNKSTYIKDKCLSKRTNILLRIELL